MRRKLPLFFIGICGVVALYFDPSVSSLPANLVGRFSEDQFRLLSLINPALLLLAASIFGSTFASRTGLRSHIAGVNVSGSYSFENVRLGILFGILTGIGSVSLGLFLQPFLIFVCLGKFQIHLSFHHLAF